MFRHKAGACTAKYSPACWKNCLIAPSLSLPGKACFQLSSSQPFLLPGLKIPMEQGSVYPAGDGSMRHTLVISTLGEIKAADKERSSPGKRCSAYSA